MLGSWRKNEFLMKISLVQKNALNYFGKDVLLGTTGNCCFPTFTFQDFINFLK